MTNSEFIKKFGKSNFNDLKNTAHQELFILKTRKIINGYNINNTKGKIILYKNKIKRIVDLAFIYDYNINKINNIFKQL